MRLSELADWLELPWEGEEDPEIDAAAGFSDAGPGTITFVDTPALERRLADTTAGAVIARPGVACPRPVIRAEQPRLVFARVLERFAPPLERVFPAGIHPSAVVAPEAELAEGVAVAPGCVIGPGARIGAGTRLGPRVVVEADAVIGRDCLLHAGAVVRERCRLGDRVVLQAGAVIGSDGFGYVPGPDGLYKIPQIGIVVLEDDVEVGANACIDRATTGVTRIGRGSKIDNLVQVGHNVRIGNWCAISAQSGISGSCVLEDRVTLGGQVGIADHLTVGEGARVAAQSGITRDVPPGQTVFGYPAVEFRRAFRQVALVQRLPALAQRLPELARRLEELERRLADEQQRKRER